jgi:cytochrome P450
MSTWLQGRQACLGRKFAELVLAHVLARMLFRYEFEIVDQDFDLSMQKSNLLWERMPCFMKLAKVC